MRAASIGDIVKLRNPVATRPWQHVLEPLSGYLQLAQSLHSDLGLHGQPFNFGPSANQNYSVGDLVTEMASYWNNCQWQDVSEEYGGPYESGLLKLNCDKALHKLRWRAVWSFEDTTKETTLWYKRFYEDKARDMTNYSLSQIDSYCSRANELDLVWAN